MHQLNLSTILVVVLEYGVLPGWWRTHQMMVATNWTETRASVRNTWDLKEWTFILMRVLTNDFCKAANCQLAEIFVSKVATCGETFGRTNNFYKPSIFWRDLYKWLTGVEYRATSTSVANINSSCRSTCTSVTNINSY